MLQRGLLTQEYFDMEERLNKMQNGINRTFLEDITDSKPKPTNCLFRAKKFCVHSFYSDNGKKSASAVYEAQLNVKGKEIKIDRLVRMNKETFNLPFENIPSIKTPQMNLIIRVFRNDFTKKDYVVVSTVLDYVEFTLVDTRKEFNVLKRNIFDNLIVPEIEYLKESLDSVGDIYTHDNFVEVFTPASAILSKVGPFVYKGKSIEKVMEEYFTQLVSDKEYSYWVHNDYSSVVCMQKISEKAHILTCALSMSAKYSEVHTAFYVEKLSDDFYYYKQVDFKKNELKGQDLTTDDLKAKAIYLMLYVEDCIAIGQVTDQELLSAFYHSYLRSSMVTPTLCQSFEYLYEYIDIYCNEKKQSETVAFRYKQEIMDNTLDVDAHRRPHLYELTIEKAIKVIINIRAFLGYNTLYESVDELNECMHELDMNISFDDVIEFSKIVKRLNK